MKRRDVLAATGLGLAGAAGAWYLFGRREGAGIEHHGTIGADMPINGDFPTDDDPADGYPPAFEDPPDPADADTGTFQRYGVNGEKVKLAPLDVVETWYYRGEARFVDARGVDQYKHAHVYGAVKSTAQGDSSGGGIDGWPEDDRIVTYCGCPHHLSSQRAAGFQKAGYTEVYALDEGFGPWNDRGYPMAGTAFQSSESRNVAEYELRGVVAPKHAGDYAWARTDGSAEAAPIRDDGTFAMHVRFPGATSETAVEVSTPAYSVTKPLGELASATIDGE